MALLNEFFLVFVKLRLAMPNTDLAYKMSISKTSVSHIFRNWITVMSIELLARQGRVTEEYAFLK